MQQEVPDAVNLRVRINRQGRMMLKEDTWHEGIQAGDENPLSLLLSP